MGFPSKTGAQEKGGGFGEFVLENNPRRFPKGEGGGMKKRVEEWFGGGGGWGHERRGTHRFRWWRGEPKMLGEAR